MRTAKMVLFAAIMMFAGSMITHAECGKDGCDKDGKKGGEKSRQGMKSGHGRKGGHHGQMMMKGLDLTEAQKEQIKAVHEENKKAMQAAMKTMNEARQALRKASHGSDDVDEAAIRDLATNAAEAMADMAILKATTNKEMQTILTDDQKEKLKEKRSEMKERMKKMKGKCHNKKGTERGCRTKKKGCDKEKE